MFVWSQYNSATVDVGRAFPREHSAAWLSASENAAVVSHADYCGDKLAADADSPGAAIKMGRFPFFVLTFRCSVWRRVAE